MLNPSLDEIMSQSSELVPTTLSAELLFKKHADVK